MKADGFWGEVKVEDRPTLIIVGVRRQKDEGLSLAKPKEDKLSTQVPKFVFNSRPLA
jgi:hypothetical protein